MQETPQQVIVTGASGGLGQAMLRALLRQWPEASIAATRFRGEPSLSDDRVSWHQLDLRDAAAIEVWAAEFERVDWVVNCAGFLHDENRGPEKSIRNFDPEFFSDNLRINTLPTLILARSLSPALKRSARPLLATISARVGSIEDNYLGGWYSYRISKAALNMALKTLSIEWKHSHPRGVVAALHPGTNDTALSRPFLANVRPENLFDPDATAIQLVALLSRLDATRSGRFWAWDGTILPR